MIYDMQCLLCCTLLYAKDIPRIFHIYHTSVDTIFFIFYLIIIVNSRTYISLHNFSISFYLDYSYYFIYFLFQVIMATNRADTLDPALLRPGRLDRKIEFPMPDRRQKRLIFSTITSKMNLSDEVDLEDCIFSIFLCSLLIFTIFQDHFLIPLGSPVDFEIDPIFLICLLLVRGYFKEHSFL